MFGVRGVWYLELFIVTLFVIYCSFFFLIILIHCNLFLILIHCKLVEEYGSEFVDDIKGV